MECADSFSSRDSSEQEVSVVADDEAIVVMVSIAGDEVIVDKS
jgi:hypothetical protein